MNYHNGFVLLVAALAMGKGHATTLGSLTLKELYELSDTVVVVQVQSGKIVTGRGGEICGASYTGRVISHLKGEASPEGIVVFGPYFGEAIGLKRVLFLNQKTEFNVSRSLWDDFSPEERKSKLAGCYDLLPDNIVNVRGIGSIEIGNVAQYSYRDAALFKEEWISVPKSLGKRKRERGDDRIISSKGESWVLLEDIVSYLHTLESKEGE